MKTALDQPEFDFERQLPAGRFWFSIEWLADHWRVSVSNIVRLIEDGSLNPVVDLAPVASKHALPRIHREALVAFMDERSGQPRPWTLFDIREHLPQTREFYSVHWLAGHWAVSERTVKRLIEDGSLPLQLDLAPAASRHALHRVHREGLVAFLNDRSNLDKFEALRRERRDAAKESL